MTEDYPMGFDWIFFVIVFTPVALAIWQLVRTRNDPRPRLEDPWISIFREKEPWRPATERPVRVLTAR